MSVLVDVITIYVSFLQTFLSHKYGYRPLQRVIEAEEFETITRNVTGQELERLEK